MGEIAKKILESMLKMVRACDEKTEHYVGRRSTEMKVRGRRKRGRPTKRLLDKVKDDNQ